MPKADRWSSDEEEIVLLSLLPKPISHLDEGTYGVVWKARDNATQEIVAIKQIKFDSDMTKEGFPISALREIGVLLSLSHESIVSVREMVVGSTPDKVFMVMDCFEMDLQAAMKKGPGASTPFAQSEVKYMMRQILSAMAHVTSIARKYEHPARNMTQMVVTLWYRAPELLFSESCYGPEIDTWSIGCIFGELLIKEAILKGTGELDQIQKIFKLLGTPTDDEYWEQLWSKQGSTFKWKNNDSDLARTFAVNSFSATGQSYLSPDGFDLLSRLLSLNPKKRITAEDALRHSYFSCGVTEQVPMFYV
ncbi:cyclin-dependent kinase [Skeletonema marinoi]|uniref:Cyclin-dependent kinase 2 homolog n=1 Tax=Skeletonema marinoi TaxID=267567 RepID=A0AAD9D6H2_9STRA|nr:cyclin-dependent kinase [Skeletonema marinoi]